MKVNLSRNSHVTQFRPFVWEPNGNWSSPRHASWSAQFWMVTHSHVAFGETLEPGKYFVRNRRLDHNRADDCVREITDSIAANVPFNFDVFGIFCISVSTTRRARAQARSLSPQIPQSGALV